MKDMAICILTRGRPNRQITLQNLPKRLRRMTYLVVDKTEYNTHVQYKGLVKKILKMPPGWGNFIIDGYGNFSDKKQWVSENINERFYFILDDDLSFNVRKDGKLIKAEQQDICDAFNIMYGWLKDGIAHVALSAREGNNRIKEDYVDVVRAMRVCGFDLKVIRKEKIKFNNLILKADFDTTLGLLEKGYKNRVLFSFAQGHRKINDSGGCSLYRTLESMEEAANKLYFLHPKYVRVEERKTAKPWPGFDRSVRIDVTILWKKAYNDAVVRKRNKGKLDFLK